MAKTVKLLPLKFRVQSIAHLCMDDDCPKVNPLEQLILKTLYHQQSSPFIKLSNTCKVSKLQLQSLFNLKCLFCQKIVSFDKCYMSNAKPEIYCTGCLSNKILNNNGKIASQKNQFQDKQKGYKQQISVLKAKLTAYEEVYEKLLREKDQQIKKLKLQIDQIGIKSNQTRTLNIETLEHKPKVQTSQHEAEVQRQGHGNNTQQQIASIFSESTQNAEQNGNHSDNFRQSQSLLIPHLQQTSHNQDSNDNHTSIEQSDFIAKSEDQRQQNQYVQNNELINYVREQTKVNGNFTIRYVNPLLEQLQLNQNEKDKINKTQTPTRGISFIVDDEDQEKVSQTQMMPHRISFQVQHKYDKYQQQLRQDINSDSSICKF